MCTYIRVAHMYVTILDGQPAAIVATHIRIHCMDGQHLRNNDFLIYIILLLPLRRRFLGRPANTQTDWGVGWWWLVGTCARVFIHAASCKSRHPLIHINDRCGARALAPHADHNYTGTNICDVARMRMQPPTLELTTAHGHTAMHHHMLR